MKSPIGWWLRRRCPIHDQPTPLATAELEQATGVNPHAIADLDRQLARGEISFVDRFSNAKMIDCGRKKCRSQR